MLQSDDANLRHATPAIHEQRYRAVFDSSSVAILVWDAKGVIIDWNPRSESLFGWSRDEAVGRNAMDLIVPDDCKPLVRDVVKTLIDDASTRPNVNENLTKSGRRITCEWFNAPLRDADGRVIGALSMAVDISERVQAERALRMIKNITAAVNVAGTIEQSLSIALDEVLKFTGWDAAGAFMPAEDGKYRVLDVRAPGLTVDPAMMETLKERRWPLDASTIVGRVINSRQPEWVMDVLDTPDPARAAHVDIAAALGVNSVVAFPALTSDRVGAVILLASKRFEPQHPLLMELMADVGVQLGRALERSAAEASLRESEEKFRILAESANVMIGMIRGNRILYLNPYMAKLTGYTQEELQSMTVDQMTHPDHLQQAAERRKRRSAGENVRGSVEYKMIAKDGGTFWMEITSTEMAYRGEVVTIGVGVDITERKRIAEELDDRLKFEAMVADLSATLVNASGDEVPAAVDNALKRVAEMLRVDRITLMERAAGSDELKVVSSHVLAGPKVEPLDGMEKSHPWVWRKLKNGEWHWFTRMSELPPEAAADCESWVRRSTKSHLVVPLSVGGEVRFVLSVATVTHERAWSDALARRLCVFGGVLANALVNARLDRELQQREAMLRSLNAELSKSEDRQRRKLASVLHDDLAQNLFAATAELVALRDSKSPSSPKIESFNRIIGLLDAALRQTRDLTFEICPPVLYDLGLPAALAKLVEKFTQQHGVRFSLKSPEMKVPMDTDLASLLYQAVRELLMNVVRHAHAKHAEVEVDRSDQHLTIRVTDDGVGCSACSNQLSVSPSGFGLFNIRERLHALGGQVVLTSGDGGGCSVRLVLPTSRLASQGSKE